MIFLQEAEELIKIFVTSIKTAEKNHALAWLNVRYWIFVSLFDVGRSMFDVGRSSFKYGPTPYANTQHTVTQSQNKG